MWEGELQHKTKDSKEGCSFCKTSTSNPRRWFSGGVGN